MQEAPSETLQKMFFDSNVLDSDYLSYLVRKVSPGHIFVGTDYPYQIRQQDPARFISNPSFSPAELESLEWLAAEKFLNEQIAKLGSGVAAFVARDGRKVAVAVAVSDDLTGTHSAATLVNAGAAEVGGRGGGKPGMAQAGGSQPENAEKALDAIKAALAG